MKIKITFATLILLLVSCTVFAQTGKISGKVTDVETGEPLIGANIIIQGTSLGAATNVDGEFIILNIPPNTYTLVGKYIGYKDVVQSNIRVSVNVTTQVDFALPSETYELGAIEIIALKPLINKNVTNSVSIVGAEDIENLPVRGVNAVVSTQAGVVNQGGDLYVRGGRSDAVAFYVDGVLVNDPVFGGATTLGIQNAIQEIQFQAGGYPAEYGGANAGIVSTTTKIGGEQYNITFEGITDNLFANVGEQFLDTYSYGYSEYIMTLSGPILPSFKNLRFFLAGSNTFTRTPIRFHRGFEFTGLYNPAAPKDTFDIRYPDGYRLNNARNDYNFQGNISWNLNPFSVKLGGSYFQGEARNGRVYLTHRTANRAGLHEDETITGNLKITHVLSPTSFYDLILNYFSDYAVDMDPVFKHNITAYGDSVANAAVGSELDRDGANLSPLTIYGFNFARGIIPYNLYLKTRNNSLGGKLNLLYQIGQHHEVKTGGEFTYYSIRRYSLPNPVSIASLRRAIPDGEPVEYYDRLDNYGYDVYGNQVDDENRLDAPRHPVFAAFYIQDKMEFDDLVVNAGLRLDYIDIAGKEFINPNNIRFIGNEIDQNTLKDTEPIAQVSPRLGFSFPVTDKTVFHAQYGKFIQQSRLRDVYQGFNVIADNIRGGFAIEAPVGFGLRPERTTQYEIGFKQQLGEQFAFNITGFYRDIKDQVQIRSVFAESGANHRQYYAFVNNDFSTVKGVELSLDLRRTQRLSATLDYTYSDALGTGSNPSSSFRQIWQSPTADPVFPQQIAPLDFNQAHTGFLNLDYRFAKDDGPEVFGGRILQNFGINALFSFKSGFNFTRWDNESFGNRRFPVESLNASTTPWTFQIDMKIDKSIIFGPVETNIYLWVINVLNTQNVVDVFNVSGDAYDDGWLSSPQGLTTVENIRNAYGDDKAEQYKSLYSALTYDPNNFGPPRQIRLGIRLSY